MISSTFFSYCRVRKVRQTHRTGCKFSLASRLAEKNLRNSNTPTEHSAPTVCPAKLQGQVFLRFISLVYTAVDRSDPSRRDLPSVASFLCVLHGTRLAQPNPYEFVGPAYDVSTVRDDKNPSPRLRLLVPSTCVGFDGAAGESRPVCRDRLDSSCRFGSTPSLEICPYPHRGY